MESTSTKSLRMKMHAMNLQKTLESAFDCDAFSLGGFIEADYIQKQGFIPAIMLLLSKKYIHTGNRQVIDEFLKDIKDYAGSSMDDLEEDRVEIILNKLDYIRNRIS